MQPDDAGPQRLRRASLMVAGLAGATAALLGSFGWHLYREASVAFAFAVWVFSAATVASLLLLALAGGAMADQVQRAASDRRALRQVEQRLARIEQRLESAGPDRPSEPPADAWQPATRARS